jgi:hypothetical protein
MRRLASALVVLGLTPAAASAQPAKASAVVRIDFRALTDDGQQVSDLKADEVTLKINGKPRQIQTLSRFQSAASGPPSGESALPPPYATNVVGESGRMIHILIDDDSIAPGREGPLRDAVRQLTSELGPGDQIGVLTAQGQINMRPAADATKVRLAVDNLAGRASASETESDAQCRTTRVLAALSSMIAITGGTPTTILVFSGGLTPPAVKMIDMSKKSTPTAATAATATSDICPVRPEDFQNIATLASTAHADLYLFHLTDAMAARSTAQDTGFESLAGVTGAEFVRLG